MSLLFKCGRSGTGAIRRSSDLICFRCRISACQLLLFRSCLVASLSDWLISCFMNDIIHLNVVTVTRFPVRSDLAGLEARAELRVLLGLLEGSAPGGGPGMN